MMAQSNFQALEWVRDNYEVHENGVVAKSVIYKHYEVYCKEIDRNTMETSIFGRVVKQVFPDVQIRRLGGRENLKYYYCGIQAKASSPYVSDNTNTIRPKRKQRKRYNITDKIEAQKCLEWLYCNYYYDSVSTVRKNDMYDHYVQDVSGFTSPLNLQDFTIVIANGLAKLSKRKMSSKLHLQESFAGFNRRPVPLDTSSLPSDLYPFPDNSTTISQSAPHDLPVFREGSNTPDDEEDYSRHTPESDGSDFSVGNQVLDLKDEPEDYYPEDQPVDYSLPSLRVKSEPIDEELGITNNSVVSDLVLSSYQTDSPHSNMMSGHSSSPSPPQKSTSKIYKPRFHINYEENRDWDISRSQSEPQSLQSQFNLWDEMLKHWLTANLEADYRTCVDRYQIYDAYERYCQASKCEVLPLAHFDKLVLKLYPGTVTKMDSPRVTKYEGVRVITHSYLDSQLTASNWNGGYDNQMDTSSPPPVESERGASSVVAADSPYNASPQIYYPHNGPTDLSQRVPSSYTSIGSSQNLSDGYPRSPELSRAFRECLRTQGAMDGARMVVRSPDVAPDNIFPRSPEGSAAQTCRSPASSLTYSDSHLAMLGSSGMFLSQPGLLSSSPTAKRGQLNSNTQPMLYPGQLLSSDVHYLNKKVKHQVASENYSNNFSGRS